MSARDENYGSADRSYSAQSQSDDQIAEAEIVLSDLRGRVLE